MVVVAVVLVVMTCPPPSSWPVFHTRRRRCCGRAAARIRAGFDVQAVVSAGRAAREALRRASIVLGGCGGTRRLNKLARVKAKVGYHVGVQFSGKGLHTACYVRLELDKG